MKASKDVDIQNWEDHILKMSDAHFFGIIRAYFGAITTPFNKHDLLERLISFLRNECVQRNIINALSYEDIQMLTAIYYLKTPSVSTIMCYFFCDKPRDVRARLINLRERLVIYRVDSSNKDDYRYIWYSINPILKDVLLPILHVPFLIPYEDKQDCISSGVYATPVFFLTLYSYINDNRDMFKKDGDVKKKAVRNFAHLFSSLQDAPVKISSLMERLEALHLITKCDGEVLIVESQWERFAKLEHLEKIIYLSIAEMFEHYLRMYGVNMADVLNEFVHILQRGLWYLEEDVYRTFFLVYKSFVEQHDYSLSSYDDSCFYMREGCTLHPEVASIKILCIAEDLGLFVRQGNLLALNEYFWNVEEDERPLLISSTFEITVNQNAMLSRLLPLLPGMKAASLHNFASFEFNRNTCEKLFQYDMDACHICTLFESVSIHPIPQNIRMSIEQWYESYRSISFYHGYVVCVEKRKKKFFQEGTLLSKFIKKEIADGVYLLSISSPLEIEGQLKKAGLDFIFFNITENSSDVETLVYKIEKVDCCIKSKERKLIKDELKIREKEYLVNEGKCIKKLNSISLDKDNREILYNRIKRRVVLLEEQINVDAINNRVKKVEGLDFIGKVKLLEEARDNKCIVEVTTANKDVIVGVVHSVYKTADNSQQVRIMEDEDDKSSYTCLEVSRILKIKVVMNSIFS